MLRYVIGIDQGTSGSYVCLMNGDGDSVAGAYQSHPPSYPRPGWVEQDPLELWRIACALVNQVIQQAAVTTGEIAAIGVANQGESVLLWDSDSGMPLGNVLVWQDTRAHDAAAALAADAALSDELRQRTGLLPDSYFSAFKIRWLLDQLPEARPLAEVGRLCCGTLDTWLIWNLTDRRAFVTDVSTASRTLLFNIHTLEWDAWLLQLFDIPRAVLPDVLPSAGTFGIVASDQVACRGIPIVASLVDQPAAMVGQGCLQAGQIKATFGTGCFVNLNTGTAPVSSTNGLLTLLAWRRDGATTYGLDGGVLTAGAVVSWLRDSIGLMPSVEAMDALCDSVGNSNGVICVPAHIGLGAPYWNRSARAAWLGIGLDTQTAHLVRAALEGIALRVAQIVRAMRRDTGLQFIMLRADGGLTRSRTLMQLQANVLGCPVEVMADAEATARGACYLAARQSGLWTSDERIILQSRIAKRYEPACSNDERERMLANYDRVVSLVEAYHDGL